MAQAPSPRGSEDVMGPSKLRQKQAGQPGPVSRGERQTGCVKRQIWCCGQGDLVWDLRMVMFSIILVAITIALDDAGKKVSKRRPENEPALDSSSREVNSRVEALRFDRRAGALALHFCGFSNRYARSFFLHFNCFFFTLL